MARRPKQCGILCTLPKQESEWEEHLKVHKVLRHQVIPGLYKGSICSAVKGVRKTISVLKKL